MDLDDQQGEDKRGARGDDDQDGREENLCASPGELFATGDACHEGHEENGESDARNDVLGPDERDLCSSELNG